MSTVEIEEVVASVKSPCSLFQGRHRHDATKMAPGTLLIDQLATSQELTLKSMPCKTYLDALLIGPDSSSEAHFTPVRYIVPSVVVQLSFQDGRYLNNTAPIQLRVGTRFLDEGKTDWTGPLLGYRHHGVAFS